MGNEPRYSLHSLATLQNLRDTLGHDLVPQDFGASTGGRDIVFNKGVRVVGFEFFTLEGLTLDRLTYPVTGMTQSHAQAMCLAIGADLMTDAQYEAIATNQGRRKHATPTGELFGPNGEEYVVSSIRSPRNGPDSVENSDRPDDGVFGVRDYTGNVAKWMKRNPAESFEFSFRDGSCFLDDTGCFSVRGYLVPISYVGVVGFLAAAPA